MLHAVDSQHHPDHLGLCQRDIECAGRDPGKPDGGIDVDHLVGHTNGKSRHGVRDQCLQKLLAISKIIVEGAVRHPRLGGEVGDAEPVTLVGEHHHRRIEQQMTGALSLLVATRGGSGQRPHHHPNLIKVDDFVNID